MSDFEDKQPEDIQQPETDIPDAWDETPADNTGEGFAELSKKEEPVVESYSDEDEEEVQLFIPDQKKQNFEIEFPQTAPHEGERDERLLIAESVRILRENQKTIAHLEEHFEKFLSQKTAEEEKLYAARNDKGSLPSFDEVNHWLNTYFVGKQVMAIAGYGDEALSREGSKWTQAFEQDGRKIRCGIPKQRLNPDASPAEISTYQKRKKGLGAPFNVVLPSSGIWLKLKSPDLVDLIAVKQEVANIKIELGRRTKGMIFSHISQSISNVAVDFALNLVEDANVDFATPTDLKEKIQLPDLNFLLGAAGVTMFPTGFDYSTACVSDITKCDHIEHERLDIKNLFFIDEMHLTKEQRNILKSGFNPKITEETRLKYLEESARLDSTIVWMGETGLELKVPNLQEYEDTGNEWINAIVDMTSGTFNEPPHGPNRHKYISRLVKATEAMQYRAWIKAVILKDDEDEVRYTNSEIIDDTVANILSVDDNVIEYNRHLTAYIEKVTRGLLAIKNYDCPKCNTPQATVFKERFPHLIPFDPLSYFFTLVNLKEQLLKG